MKFHIVGPSYPFRGGIAQYIGVLGEKLRERGHRVKVLSFRKQFPKFFFPGQTQLESSQSHIDLNAERVFVPWNPVSWFRTFWYVKKDEPDAVIFKYWMPFFAPGFAAVCALTKWFTESKVIYILDNVIPHERRWGDRLLTRLGLRWVDAFIAQSKTVQDDLFKWFPEARERRVIYVPHPIYDCYNDSGMSREDARSKLNIALDKKILLFFGLVRQYKGLDVLITALPAIIEGLGENVHLIIAGEFYEPEAEYRRLVDDLSLGEHVTIINQYIPNEEVGIYFRAADLLVLPYKSATQSGIVQIAKNFKIPIVSTSVGGLPEAVKEGVDGFLVKPDDGVELASAVIKFFNDDVRRTITAKLSSVLEDDSWSKMCAEIERLSS